MSIAIMGGGLLYSIQSQILVTGLSTMELRITDLRLEKDVNGSCYFQTVFYNSGTELIQKIHLKTTLENGEDFVREIDTFGNGLVPGNSTEYFLSSSSGINSNECGNFTSSKTYSVFVNASSQDSTFSIIKSLKVEDMTQT